MKFKQLQIGVIFLLAFFTSRAVTPYHWECGTFTIDATDTLISCPQISTNYIYFTITNTTASTILVRQLINSVNLPAGWSMNMCNPNGCWGSGVVSDSFLVPASGFVTARFDFHVDNNQGAGIANVRFDDSAFPSVNGASFNLHAVSLGTGMSEAQNKDNAILLYPNPAVNELIVRSSEFGDKSELTIFNALGENVFFQPQTSNLKLQTVDVSQLPPGIYFVRVKTQEGIHAAKFVKQ